MGSVRVGLLAAVQQLAPLTLTDLVWSSGCIGSPMSVQTLEVCGNGMRESVCRVGMLVFFGVSVLTFW